jgi:hypothetical protein
MKWFHNMKQTKINSVGLSFPQQYVELIYEGNSGTDACCYRGQRKMTLMNQHHHHHYCRRCRLSVIRPLGLFRFETYEFIWTVGRTPWTGDQPDARPLHTHRTTQRRKMRTYIHASSGVRTHDPSVRAAEDSTYLRPLGHWDHLPLWIIKVQCDYKWCEPLHKCISKNRSYHL